MPNVSFPASGAPGSGPQPMGPSWNWRGRILLSAYHIRYGGYGGIAYYHIADTYITLCSHFLSCGTWEGLYLIDGLIHNTSAIQPDVIHADTASDKRPQCLPWPICWESN